MLKSTLQIIPEYDVVKQDDEDFLSKFIVELEKENRELIWEKFRQE